VFLREFESRRGKIFNLLLEI